MTFRAVRLLKEADLIAAEDTRHSRKLLSHFGISRPLTSYFDHNKNIKGEYILEKLKAGASVALISDAGTPSISDPGYQLVRDAIGCGVTVIPVPGPCAAIAALSAAGLPTDRFAFEGFLPHRQGKRRDRLAVLKEEPRVLVFYESPNRLPATLADMLEICGERQAVVARELTKVFEEFIRGTLSGIIETLRTREVKGEVVLLLAPAAKSENAEPDLEQMLRECLDRGFSLKDAVRDVTLASGQPRSKVYGEALRIQAGKAGTGDRGPGKAVSRES